MSNKPKLSMYWAAACGGCEISVVNLHEKILDLASNFDFVFCPCLLDTKKKDVQGWEDGSLAITLFNGSIRTEENEEMAHLLRKKSNLLIAYGSCASGGGIPALSNLHSREAHIKTNYLDNPTVDNPGQVTPATSTPVKEGVLELPRFFDTVKTLDQVAEVDYFVPGCPPEPHQLWNILGAVIQGKPLPPKGSILGAGTSSVCDECKRTKNNKTVGAFHRIHEIVPDTTTCLFEQGILCMGIATRNGCGALCPQVNMPCTGCYGTPQGVRDQGAKMISAVGSVLDIGDCKEISEQQLPEKVDAVIQSIPDCAGTFYRYGLAGSILRGRMQ
jgi:F420-non-reducing hydrogenase small subunit